MPPKPGQATHGPPYMIGSPRGMLPSIQSVGNFLTNSPCSPKCVPNAQPLYHDSRPPLDHDSRPPLDHGRRWTLMPPKPGQATHGPPYMIGSPRGMLPSIQSVGNFLTNSPCKCVPNAQPLYPNVRLMPPGQATHGPPYMIGSPTQSVGNFLTNSRCSHDSRTPPLDHDSRPPLDHDSWPSLDHDSHAAQAGPSHTRPTVHDRLTEGYASVNSVGGKLFDKFSL